MENSLETVPDWLLKRPIAHRGFHCREHGCPENSLAAFEAALARGYAIELDVHLLSDGTVAVFHDYSTRRMTGTAGNIRDLTSSELERFNLEGTAQRIPLLGDVLDLVRGKVPLLIEIKSSGRSGRCERAVLEALEDYGGAYAVQSFNPLSVRWYCVNAPHTPRGLISGDLRDEMINPLTRFVLKNLLLDWLVHPAFINYDIRCLPNRAVHRQRRKGVPILGWTARTAEEYAAAKRWCDNVLFEGFEPPAGPRDDPPHRPFPPESGETAVST